MPKISRIQNIAILNYRESRIKKILINFGFGTGIVGWKWWDVGWRWWVGGCRLWVVGCGVVCCVLWVGGCRLWVVGCGVGVGVGGGGLGLRDRVLRFGEMGN